MTSVGFATFSGPLGVSGLFQRYTLRFWLGSVPWDAPKASRSLHRNAPTADRVKNNTYKFWNIEHMYTKGPATGLAQALIDYMGSTDGKTEASKLDFLLISDMSSDAIQAHQPKS